MLRALGPGVCTIAFRRQVNPLLVEAPGSQRALHAMCQALALMAECALNPR